MSFLVRKKLKKKMKTMSSFISSSSESKESESMSNNTNPKKSYDVYLSFCSRDTGSFVSNLCTALYTKAGILVFWDDQRLGSADWVITPSVLNVIGECRIAIIVFSRNYANSRSCLQELEKIMECCRTIGQRVVPFFFDVDPSYASRPIPIGMFGKAFDDFVHRLISVEETSEEEDKFMSWVAAITKASTISGFAADNNRNEYKNVVEHVAHVLNKKDLFIADYLVGVKSRAQGVIQLLKQSRHPLFLGIWGMARIGKTTIADAIYDQIGPYFEDKSFLINVREIWQQNKELSLQERLLFDIDKATDRMITTIESGKSILKERFRHKRVLLILDDVNKLEQLHALCGCREWFGEGSKIIITTRDRHLLKEHGVDHIYRVKELDQSESLEVFNSRALLPKEIRFEQVSLESWSNEIVDYCGGLPYALAVLGSSLCGQPDAYWLDRLKSLKNFSIPDQRVQDALETSFNDLNDEEKQIFLDIACFFIGMDKNDALHTLNRSTQSAALQISLLEDKSFVTIDENNKLGMHVLLQAMAREIITRKSTNKPEPKIFDVFLSFRGEDSRSKFISHLYSSLQNAGIYVFRDDDEIQRGDQISTSLLQAIRRSRICIVILSTNYANSRWCMLELEKIMEIGRFRGVVVVPVFYEVDPSEVRHQKGQFGKAFEDLTSGISVDESTERNWRRELLGIGGIAGFVVIDSKNESADIKNIVEHVTRLLDKTELFVAEHPVGVECRVQAVTKLLDIQISEEVLLLGIWGMGGMGKTTVAKAIYNQIGRKFEGRSFLLNIREVWEKDTNRFSLQQLVLCDIYKTTTLKIPDIESGKNILKERLAQKRVLLVLDDVSELDQLKALCGSRKWFGPGSRIIITTRDKHLLRLCEVDHVYKIEEMDESESLELFSWHAFKQASPREDFAAQSRNVIAYTGRLPLALEVLGSYLFDRGIKEWQSVLEKLKIIPNNQVQKKLKISFDGLSDDIEKQIFLDIACFLIGKDRNDAIQILNGCGFFANIGINVLVERSLVTVDRNNKLRMHDLLRDMGREIIREESPYVPEKRSRLWLPKEVLDILSKHKGTEAVKGLALELPRKNTNYLNTKAFKKMNKLRLLQLTGVQLNGDFKYLSGDLRWLYWHGFPLTYTPAEFQQGSIVAIELKYSNLTQIWEKSQMLENLKILNLSHSRDLAETPDFSYLPNLEKLVLKDCPSLSVVSHTVGSLHKLLLINLTDCTGLRKLPRSIYKLKSLETLILSGCSMIDKLEEDLEQMESLITLIADRTAITKVPFSIVRSKSIGYISLCGFEGFSRDVFPSLIRSWMSPTNNVISLAETFVSMSSLDSLDFPCGSLTSAFKDLLKMRSLCVECGSELQLSQDVAKILDALTSTNFQKMESSASTSQIFDTDASPLIDYCSPILISGSKSYLKSLLIQIGTKCQVPSIAEESILQTTDGTRHSFLFPGDNNSDWLTFSCEGCSVKFEVPKVKGRNLKRMMLGIVYSSSSNIITSEGCQALLIINYTKTTIQAYKRDTIASFKDEDWQSITSNLEPGNKVKVMVVFGEGFIVEKTTVYLSCGRPFDKEMEHCYAVDEDDVIVSGDNETSIHSNPLKEENWDDEKEENPSKNQKGKSKAVQTLKSKATVTSKKSSETSTSVKIDTTSVDESKPSKKTQTRKEKNGTDEDVTSSNLLQTKNIISDLDIVVKSTENPNQEGIIALPEKTLAASTNKQAANIEKTDKSFRVSSPPKAVAGELVPSNSNLSYIDDVKKMLDNDPVAVMDKLLSEEFNHSFRNMQTSSEVATSQIDLFALEAELDKLRQLAFSNNLFAELPDNQELQAAVNASIQYIEARHKDLTLQQYVGFSEFSKLFNKAIESINVGNIVSSHLSQLAYEEKEFVAALQTTRNEVKQFETSIDTGRKRMTEIETECKQIEDEIATLKEKLRLIKQEEKVLEETCNSCKVKHEEAINKGKDILTTVLYIKEKIAGYESQEKENNAMYAELTDSYKRMKAFPPFKVVCLNQGMCCKYVILGVYFVIIASIVFGPLIRLIR